MIRPTLTHRTGVQVLKLWHLAALRARVTWLVDDARYTVAQYRLWTGALLGGLLPWSSLRSKWAFLRVMWLLGPWHTAEYRAMIGRGLLYLDAERRAGRAL
jgi:hypothetical protein